MGAKGSKKDVPPKPPKMNSKDLKFLVKQTGMSKEDVNKVFTSFVENNSDAILTKQEFCVLYDKLRPETAEQIDEIAGYVFECFDADDSGTINFNEFMIAYAMTSRGDYGDKLNYAFDLYDIDENGTLNKTELRAVLECMLDLLGADKRGYSSEDLANKCLTELDDSLDGKITKEEFISGLLENYSLRALMSPFNQIRTHSQSDLDTALTTFLSLKAFNFS